MPPEHFILHIRSHVGTQTQTIATRPQASAAPVAGEVSSLLLTHDAEGMKDRVLKATFLCGVTGAAMTTLLKTAKRVPIFGEVFSLPTRTSRSMWRCLLNRGRVEALPAPKFVSKAASLPQCPAAGQRASTWEEDVHLYVCGTCVMYVWLIYAGLGGSVTHGGY